MVRTASLRRPGWARLVCDRANAIAVVAVEVVDGHAGRSEVEAKRVGRRTCFERRRPIVAVLALDAERSTAAGASRRKKD